MGAGVCMVEPKWLNTLSFSFFFLISIISISLYLFTPFRFFCHHFSFSSFLRGIFFSLKLGLSFLGHDVTTINHLNFRERVLHLANVISKLRLPLRCFDDLGDNGKKVNFFSLSFVTLIVFFEMSSFFDVNFVLCLFFLYRLEGTLLYFVALSLVYFPLFLKKIILIEAPNMTSDVALGGELGLWVGQTSGGEQLISSLCWTPLAPWVHLSSLHRQSLW